MKFASFIYGYGFAALMVCTCACGCNSNTDTPKDTDTTNGDPVATTEKQAVLPPQVFELDVDRLLAMRLSPELSGQGWIRLFDGQSLFGWDMAGLANWSINDDALVVDAGEKSLLCTSLPWNDYEFQVEYRADASTNSGIFFQTSLMPQDPATDCYELNIAPSDNPFPTASLVGRQKFEPAELGELDHDQWHKFFVRVEGDKITVTHNDVILYTYTDPNPLRGGRIGLQHNSGRVAFRNVMLRPLNLTSLLPEAKQETVDEVAVEEPTIVAGWKQYPEMAGRFSMDKAGQLRVQGGKGQLETETEYGDFVLFARARTNGENQNSGLFFRCIPGEEMNGYECQINNDATDGNPMFPADCGTGGIFRRQDARVIAAGNDEWFDLLLTANGTSIAAWVNGIQVSQWQDTRPADSNPRKGSRIDPGTIIIQAHDETTDVTFAELKIVPQ